MSTRLQLPYLRLTFRATAQTTVNLPPFTGSTLRGAIGQEFRRSACTTGESLCDGCPLLTTCAFGQIWEGATDKELPKRFGQPPRPYVFVPPVSEKPLRLAPHESIKFSLVLLGNASLNANLMKRAVLNVDQIAGKGRLLIEATESSEGLLVFHPSEQHTPVQRTLSFETPLQLKEAGEPLQEFDPTVFTSRLIQRAELLAYMYGGHQELDFQRLIDLSRYARVLRADLKPWNFERVSNRQGRRVPMKGFTGRVMLDGVHPDVAKIWEFAEVINAGKQATFGFGRVRSLEGCDVGEDTTRGLGGDSGRRSADPDSGGRKAKR